MELEVRGEERSEEYEDVKFDNVNLLTNTVNVGIGNTYMRDSWRDMLLQSEVKRDMEFDEMEVAEARALVDMVLKEEYRKNERRVMRAELMENWDL